MTSFLHLLGQFAHALLQPFLLLGQVAYGILSTILARTYGFIFGKPRTVFLFAAVAGLFVMILMGNIFNGTYPSLSL